MLPVTAAITAAGGASAKMAMDFEDAMAKVTTIMNAYGLEASDVTKVSDVLIQTQNLGKTTVGELSSSMGKIIPTAKANQWEWEGLDYSYETVLNKAELAEPFSHIVDPEDELFIAPINMEEAMNGYCRKTNQTEIKGQGSFYRTVMESLAFKYRESVNDLERVTGKEVDTIYLLGGAVQDSAFCQYISNATGKTVLAGSVEATAVGNAMIQFRATGVVQTDEAAVTIIKNSFDIQIYKPADQQIWERQYLEFQKMTGK